MSILRACGSPLAAILADGSIPLLVTDLFTFVEQDGSTTHRFTSWDSDLTVDGELFTSADPWMSRSGWSLSNTMTVPKLTIEVLNSNASYAGGASFKAQLRNGLFDGASMLLQTLFMMTPGDTSLGAIDVFAGVTGQIDVAGAKTVITCKGKNNLLDQFVPRNVYQLGCNLGFCDPGCTLSRGSFTFSYSIGSSPTKTFIPWASAPSTPGRFQSGSIRITSGPASGSWRTITKSDSSGLTLAYPLATLPLASDGFTAFQGCDKTKATCDGTYSNLQHFRGFPFVPPPDTTF